MARAVSTPERELKFRATRSQVEKLGGRPLATRVFTSHYYDTPDSRLARAGVTLRRRDEGDGCVWQLKVPRGDARLQVTAPGRPAQPPEELLSLLEAPASRRQLVEVAALRTRRSGRSVDGVEVTVDRVDVVGGDHAGTRFVEVEAELVGEDPRRLERVAKRLEHAGAKPTDGTPKLWQVIGLPKRDDRFPRGGPSPVRLRAMLAAQRDEVLRHDVGIRADGDPDDVHEMRVAVRRLRAFLRAARPMLERRSADRLRADLDRLAGPLGAVRDLDVLLAGLAGEIASLDGREALDAPELLTILRGQRDAALARLLEFLESATYLALLAALDDAVDAPRIRDPDASLRRIARAEFRKLRKAVRALGDPPSDRALHKVRIRGKRARYAAELAEAKAGKRAGKLIAEAKRFQDVLGEHQDAVVATGALRGLGAESRASGATFAAGRLFERERLRRQEARAGFPRSWRRLKKAGKKAWG